MSTNPYYMGFPHDPSEECRLSSNVDVNNDELAEAGVILTAVDMNEDWESELNKLAAVYCMQNRDEIHISRSTMPEFDKKLKVFFEEHLHRDAEVRFIKDGSGFFDVRSLKDQWIRIPVKRGDFLYLPAGIYHRFTTDKNEYIVAIRLFREAPKWEALPRCSDTDKLEERRGYLKTCKIENERNGC